MLFDISYLSSSCVYLVHYLYLLLQQLSFPTGLVTVSSRIILSDTDTGGLYCSLTSTNCLHGVSTPEGCFPLCAVLWFYPSHLLTWPLACGLPASDG